MNRRSFLDTLLKGAAAFSILPAATTYARTWKFSDAGLWECVLKPCTPRELALDVVAWQVAYNIVDGRVTWSKTIVAPGPPPKVIPDTDWIVSYNMTYKEFTALRKRAGLIKP